MKREASETIQHDLEHATVNPRVLHESPEPIQNPGVGIALSMPSSVKSHGAASVVYMIHHQ